MTSLPDQVNATDTALAGVESPARLWEPSGDCRGAFVLLHGSESHSGWFEPIGGLLAERGYAVTAYDRPGWGRSNVPEESRGHLDSYADALGWVEEQADRARRRYGRVHLAGQSWGGLLALYAALRRGILFDSVTVITPGLVTRKDVAPGSELTAAWAAARRQWRRKIPLGFVPADFTHHPEWQRYIADDPLAVRNITVGFAVETMKMRQFIKENAGKRVLPPTLALFASHDTIIANKPSINTTLKCGATVRVYAGARHSLPFETPRRLAGDLADWADASANAMMPRSGGRVMVMGAGAVGQTVGALMALAGHDTTLVARPVQAAAIREHGVLLRFGRGVRPVGEAEGLRVVERPIEAPDPGLAILTVKSYDTRQALLDLVPALSHHGAVLSLQNGLGNERLIAGLLPERTVLAGAVCAYLELTAPGAVHWADDRGGFAGAAYADPAGAGEEVWRLYFDRLYPQTRWVAAKGKGGGDKGNPAGRVKWSKLCLNVAFNAINAGTGLPTAAILAHPEYGPLAVGALKETFTVMRRKGIVPVDLPGYPVRVLGRLSRWPTGVVRRLLAWKTGRENTGASSMRQDRERGRTRTELGDINGAVSAAAAELGLRAPANDEIVRRFGGAEFPERNPG